MLSESWTHGITNDEINDKNLLEHVATTHLP